MKNVTWLLAGAGDIATRRAGPALVDAENSQVVAICDINREHAEKLAEQLHVNTVYTNFQTALTECGADAVYLATPQFTHIEMSVQTLEAGKHLLCEKPLGRNGEECMTLLNAAQETHLTTSCSNYRRLSEQYKITEKLLRNGEIGTLAGGWAVYSAPFYNPGNHPIKKELGMSRIKELGFYLIDIVHNFFGMPSSVMAQAGTINKAVMNDVDDISSVILRFPDDKLFTIMFNCNSPVMRHEMEFFGSDGCIYWDQWPPHGNGPVIKQGGPEGRQEFPARTNNNFHLPMIEDFVDALLTGRAPVCTIESATKTEIITDAIFRSIDSGKLESINWEQ